MNKWYKRDKKLPDKSGLYLACVEGMFGKGHVISDYDAERNEFSIESVSAWNPMEVIAWMELPNYTEIADEQESPMKAYIVTSGEYSDYSIDAVYMDRESAEAYLMAHYKDSWGGMRVEEYEVGEQKSAHGKRIYEVNLYRGKWYIKATNAIEGADYTEGIIQAERYPHQHPSQAKWSFTQTVITDRGEDVALKIAQDNFYMLKQKQIEEGRV